MNVMIVDDEPIIRIGLRTLIEWEKCGMKLVGEAADGEEALEIMARNTVDIIVTDIRMPRMDGLELIRLVQQNNDSVGVLVLSCLDDFSFVKEAMKLGARDYILKPTMEPEELVRVLQSIGTQLDKERTEKEHIRQLNVQLEHSRPYQMEAKILRWLHYDHLEDGLEEELFSEGRAVYTMMLCWRLPKPDIFRYDGSSAFLAAVRMPFNQQLLLFETGRTASKMEIYQESFTTATNCLKRIGSDGDADSVQCVVHVGPPLLRLEDLRNQIDVHLSQIHYRFYLGRPGQIVYDTLPSSDVEVQLPFEARNDVLKSVAGGNLDGILYHTKTMTDSILRLQPEMSRLHAFLFETLGLLIGYARDNNYDDMDHYEQQVLSMESIQSFFYVQELIDWLHESMRKLWNCRSEFGRQKSSNNPFIRKAVQYMRNNYSNNIGTIDIAGHVRLSRSYLSDLYSKEVGESLIESLTKIRIEEACKQLKSGGIRIYEIAGNVGFSDGKTFARTFKRIVGCSPKEYNGSNK